MISLIRRYRRTFAIVALVLFCFIAGLITIDPLEMVGTLFLTIAMLMIVYNLVVWILRRKDVLPDYKAWVKKEIWSILIIMALLFLIGAVESSTKEKALTLIFAVLLAFLPVFGYLFYQSLKANKEDAIERTSILRWIFWTLTIGIGLVLVILATFEYEGPATILSLFYFITLFVLAIRWLIKQLKSIINLKNEKAKTELMHLKSQVNPHFFFNMMNNLYGLMEKDIKKAQELVLKLSDMMRYSIYEGQKDLVTIDEEVKYLKNYIELHKMRYHKKIDVQFNHHIQDEEAKVMPLLFIILLENAFKHGVENLRKGAYVHINLIAGGDQIDFAVENNYDNNELSEEYGIGLKNLKRRLELVYTGKHALNFSASGDIYKVQLTLKL